MTLTARLALAHLYALRVCEDQSQLLGSSYDPCDDYIKCFREHMDSTSQGRLQCRFG
jgi:hypothetical protein